MQRDEQEVDSLITALESAQGEDMVLDFFDLDAFSVLADKDTPHPLTPFKATMKDCAVNFFKALKKYHQMVDEAKKYGDKRREYNDENKNVFIRGDRDENNKMDFQGRRKYAQEFTFNNNFDTTVKPSAPVPEDPKPEQNSNLGSLLQDKENILNKTDFLDDIIKEVGGEVDSEMKNKIIGQIDGKDKDQIRDIVEMEYNKDTKRKFELIRTDIDVKLAKAAESVRAALDKGDAVAKEICDKTIELHRKEPSRRKAKYLQTQTLCQSTKKQLVALIKDKMNLQADEGVKANAALLTNVTNEKGMFGTLLKTVNFFCSENKKMLSLVDTNDDIQMWESFVRRLVNKPINEARAQFEETVEFVVSMKVENTMDESISDVEMEAKIKNIEELILALGFSSDLMMLIKNSLNRKILYETLFKMTAAKICQMTSGKATQYMGLDANNIPIDAPLSLDDSNALSEAAMPIVAVFCTAAACLKTARENSDDGIPPSQSKIYKLCDQRTDIEMCMVDFTTCKQELKKDIVNTLFAPFEVKMDKVQLTQFSSIADASDKKLQQMTSQINIDQDPETTKSIEKFDHQPSEGMKNINIITFKDGKIVCSAESTDQLVINGGDISEDELFIEPEPAKVDVKPDPTPEQNIQRILETISANTGSTTVSFKVDATLTYNLGDIAKASGLSIDSVEGMVDEVNDLLKDPVTATVNPDTVETTTKMVSRITAIFMTLSLALFIA